MRRRPPRALVVVPITTGIFFGAVTAVLVRWAAGDARALAMGVVVGVVMFTAHALALSVVHSPPRAPRASMRDPED